MKLNRNYITLRQATKASYGLFLGCDGGVRVCDAAETLNVSKAGASLALTELAEQELVDKGADRRARLTEIGGRKAVLPLGEFDGIRTFPAKTLDVENSAADRIEHGISTDALCAICRFSKRKCCTQGRPESRASSSVVLTLLCVRYCFPVQPVQRRPVRHGGAQSIEGGHGMLRRAHPHA